MFRVAAAPILKTGWTFTGPPPNSGLSPHSPTLHVFAKVTVQLRENAPAHILQEDAALPNGDMPHPLGLEHGLLRASDYCPKKLFAEFTLAGTGYAPSDHTVHRGFPVEVRLGSLQKRLLIYGPRQWEPAGLSYDAGLPGAITSLPLTWAHSFGGEGHPWNPLGRGASGLTMHQVDYADHPLDQPLSEVFPAGLAPIPADWASRARHLGTYTENYVAESWPWFPADFDWRYFQSAPEDQWSSRPWQGDEEITLTGLFSDAQTRRFFLPGGFVACAARYHPRWTPEDAEPTSNSPISSISMTLDTIHLEPEAGRAYLTWRGVLPVATIKCPDVATIAFDWLMLGQESQSLPRCEQKISELEHLWHQASQPPAPSPPVELPPVDFSAIPTSKWIKPLADVVEKVLGAFSCQPDPSSDSDRSVESTLEELDGILGSTKASIHPPPDPDLSGMSHYRAQAQAKLEASLSHFEVLRTSLPKHLSWQEFVLSDGTMDEENIRSAFLCEANLRGARWAGADLSRLDLSGVDFSEADLSGCLLQGAILRGAKLVKTKLNGANLREAVLEGADLTQAEVEGVDWDGVMCPRALFAELNLARVNFSNFRGPEVRFRHCHLDEARFEGALLYQAEFTACSLVGTSFRAATVSAADFSHCQSQSADFSEAQAQALRVQANSDFSHSHWQRAACVGLMAEGAVLKGADFTTAHLDGARLVGAILKEASFQRCRMRQVVLEDAHLDGANFCMADLMEAVFDRSLCRHVCLDHTNLFAASFWETKLLGTSWRHAHVAQSTLHLAWLPRLRAPAAHERSFF